VYAQGPPLFKRTLIIYIGNMSTPLDWKVCRAKYNISVQLVKNVKIIVLLKTKQSFKENKITKKGTSWDQKKMGTLTFIDHKNSKIKFIKQSPPTVITISLKTCQLLIGKNNKKQTEDMFDFAKLRIYSKMLQHKLIIITQILS